MKGLTAKSFIAIVTMIKYNQHECMLDLSSQEVGIECIFELPNEVLRYIPRSSKLFNMAVELGHEIGGQPLILEREYPHILGIIVMLEECCKQDCCSRENVSGPPVELAKSNLDMDLHLPFCSWDKYGLS